MAVKTPVAPRSEEALTPRQREVLALIVKGRTNAQIAEELGISLDGAKWHVSEIITRLGVESREEAAEYWRAEHGLRLRFTRMIRALIPGGAALKWAAGGAILAATAVAVAVVIIALQQSNDDHPASSTTPPATVPATSPAATPSAAATAAPGAEVIDGVTVQPLSLGSDTTLPPGLVVYYFRAGYGKDGPFANLHRAYRDADGAIQLTDLSARLGPLGYPFTMAIDIESGRAAIGVCIQGNCGGYGAASADAKAKLMVSDDGGVNWRDAGPLPHGALLEAISADDIVIGLPPPDMSGPWKFALFPSLKEISGPAESSPVFVRGALAWRTSDGSTMDASGNPLFQAPRYASSGYPTSKLRSTASGGDTFSWLRQQEDKPTHWYLGQTDASGKLKSAYSWEGGPSGGELRGTIAVGPDLVLGNVFPPQSGFGYFPVALIDLATKTIHPVPELTDNSPGGQSFVVTAQTGTFARVNTGGDCLNVHEKPATSATSLGCFKDGVLLRILPGNTTQTDGITWQPVATPAGESGFASTEFIQR